MRSGDSLPKATVFLSSDHGPGAATQQSTATSISTRDRAYACAASAIAALAH